jgi:hypothetical protein
MLNENLLNFYSQALEQMREVGVVGWFGEASHCLFSTPRTHISPGTCCSPEAPLVDSVGEPLSIYLFFRAGPQSGSWYLQKG